MLEVAVAGGSGYVGAELVGLLARHPEVRAGLERHSARRVRFTFVPHLVPIARGILASVVLRNPGGVTQGEILQAYHRSYEGCPFVRVLDPARRLPEVGDVLGTNFCDLAPVVDAAAQTIVVVGVIDNLLKGAAGQAVQVMNIACGLPEAAGLGDGRSHTVPERRSESHA